MSNLQIEMLVATIILLILIILGLKHNSISIKNSVAWLLLPIVFIIIAVIPEPLAAFSSWLGFETFANFIFVVVIGLLIVICFYLTISNSKQQNQITKLNQELSILKHKKK